MARGGKEAGGGDGDRRPAARDPRQLLVRAPTRPADRAAVAALRRRLADPAAGDALCRRLVEAIRALLRGEAER